MVHEVDDSEASRVIFQGSKGPMIPVTTFPMVDPARGARVEAMIKATCLAAGG